MAVSKPEQYAIESAIFQFRGESGLQQMRTWLFARRDRVNEQWISAVGEDLLRLQGEAKTIKQQIKMIDEGPTHKETM